MTEIVSLDQALTHLRNYWSEYFNVSRDKNTSFSVKIRFKACANEMPPEEIIEELRALDEVEGLSIGASGSYTPTDSAEGYEYRVKGRWRGDIND